MAEPTTESAELPESGERTERVAPAAERKKRSRRGRMRRMERAELQTFFDDMVAALVRGDGKKVAELFDPPAYILGNEMARAVLTQDEIVGFFSGAKDEYQARGVLGTRAEIVRLDRITNRLVMVTLRFPWLAKDGAEVGEERSSYIVQRAVDGHIKIRVAIMRGTAERAAEAPQPH